MLQVDTTSTMRPIQIQVDSHGRKLLDMLRCFWKDEHLCDVHLKMSDGVIKAHRLVLSAFSQWFHSSTQFIAHGEVIQMELEMPSGPMRDLLSCMYGEPVELVDSYHLVSAAEILGIQLCADNSWSSMLAAKDSPYIQIQVLSQKAELDASNSDGDAGNAEEDVDYAGNGEEVPGDGGCVSNVGMTIDLDEAVQRLTGDSDTGTGDVDLSPQTNQPNSTQQTRQTRSRQQKASEGRRSGVGGLHHCSYCDYSCRNSYNMKVHERLRHTGERPYACGQCTYAAATPNLLKVHQMTHSGERPYKCTECEFSCKSKRRLREHMCRHTGKAPYVCQECGKHLTSRTMVNYHRKLHSGQRPHKCPHCDQTFMVRGNLNKHVTSVHEGKKNYYCDVCLFSCMDICNFKRHQWIHTGEKPYKCQFCDFACRSTSQRRLHVKRHHSGLPPKKPVLNKDGVRETPFPCPQCKHKSTSKEALKQHICKIHSEVKYKCQFCLYKVRRKKAMDSHMARYHSDQQTEGSQQESTRDINSDKLAPKDSKSGKQKCDTGEVLNSTTKSGKASVLHCEHCQYTCSRATTMEGHVNSVHTGIQPYKCPHCSYATITKPRLASHCRTQHQTTVSGQPLKGELGHKCDQCQFASTRQRELQKHIREVHKQNKPPKGKENTSAKKSTPKKSKQTVSGKKTSPKTPRVLHQCLLCNFCSHRKPEVEVHVRIKHGLDKASAALATCVRCKASPVMTGSQTGDNNSSTNTDGTPVSTSMATVQSTPATVAQL